MRLPIQEQEEKNHLTLFTALTKQDLSYANTLSLPAYYLPSLWSMIAVWSPLRYPLSMVYARY